MPTGLERTMVRRATQSTTRSMTASCTISSGHVQPGARVVETQLAARLGVSRIPVREALGRLRGQGLLVSDGHGRGMRLRQYSLDDITNFYDYREMLEGGAARAAEAETDRGRPPRGHRPAGAPGDHRRRADGRRGAGRAAGPASRGPRLAPDPGRDDEPRVGAGRRSRGAGLTPSGVASAAAGTRSFPIQPAGWHPVPEKCIHCMQARVFGRTETRSCTSRHGRDGPPVGGRGCIRAAARRGSPSANSWP